MAYIGYNYLVKQPREAKEISSVFLKKSGLDHFFTLGFPKFFSYYSGWVVEVKYDYFFPVGKIVVNARTGCIDEELTTSKEVLEARILGKIERKRKVNTLCAELKTPSGN